jgi:dihydroorotase-like cyclic amidohydrolase
MSTVDLLIKNGKVYIGSGFQSVDVGVIREKTAFISSPGNITDAKITIDAREKYVIPGIMDFHCHMRDPGLTHKEDLETGTKAAAAGGVTMIFPQPNTEPVPNTVENYRLQVESGIKKAVVDFNPIASPLAYEDGWVPKLVAEGTAWFKIFQKVAHYPYSTPAGTINTAKIYGAFKEVAKTGKYCSVHPFDHFFFEEAEEKVKKAGLPMTLKNYRHLTYTDEEMSGAAYELYFLAKKAKLRWYAMHCWQPGYIDLVRWAKTERVIDVVASFECMPVLNAAQQLYYPKTNEWIEIGNDCPTDLDKVFAAIKDGTIDFIGTDHAPQVKEDYKPDDPLHSVMGNAFIEWYGHLMLNEVNKGNISLEKLVQVTSVNGAKIFGFYPRKGAIRAGSDADFTICDLGREWTIDSNKIYAKSQLNGYHGRKIKGKVTHTIVRGNIVMENGEVIGKPGYGKYIIPDNQ